MTQGKNGSGGGFWGQAPAWAAIILTIATLAASGWAKAGALDQRILTLEARLQNVESNLSDQRQRNGDSLARQGQDLAYIRGRIDYLSAAVQDIRQRQK